MGILQRRIVRAVLGVVAHPKLTLTIAGAVLVACTTWAYLRLDISTDQNKLFSPKVKFFANYLAYIEKFPENEAIYVVIERADRGITPSVQRWIAAADAVAEGVRKLGPKVVKSVDVRVPVDKLGDQGLLFERPERLARRVAEVREFVPLIQLLGEKPNLLTGLLGPTVIDRFLSSQARGPGDAGQARFVTEVAQSWNEVLVGKGDPLRPGAGLPDLTAIGANTPEDFGYYYVPDETDKSNHLLLVRIYPDREFDSLTAISKTVGQIRAAVQEAIAGFSEFKAGVTGRPALEADEMSTTDRDSTRAEVIALVVVFIGLVLFLRSVWLAVAAEISLGVAIGWTFGWAELTVGELNLLSIVFLIALIGIGMDYLVQILVRYRQEVRRHASPRAVWGRVFRHVGPPINTACLGAAGAFLVAVFTDFRGAAELGIIAGGGLLLCLFAGYTVLPAILTLFPVRVTRARNQPGGAVDSAVRPSAPAGGWRLLLPVVWAVALLVGGIRYAPLTGFNPNLLELQAQNLESVQLVRKLQTFSAVVLSKDLDVLRKVRDAVKGLPSVASTESITGAYDNAAWLGANAKLTAVDWANVTPVHPDDVPRLADKARALAKKFSDAAEKSAGQDRAALLAAAEVLNELAKRLDVPADRRDAAASRLTRWQPEFLTQLKEMLTQFNPGPPRVNDLPPELRNHFVAADGTMALHILPRQDLWDREQLRQFVREIEEAVKSVPGSSAPTGIASNIFHTTASIERSFHRATAYALCLIFVLVLIDLRSIPQTLVAVSVLALGLPMLVSIMGLIGADWNFANFFGLPILIGAGHEYGVFMVHRYREAKHDPRRYWRRWDASDKALLLCAYVTCSSFGFFWLLANHRGLKSLGLVMTLGTACIYLATLLVVRPLLLWRLKRAAETRRQ